MLASDTIGSAFEALGTTAIFGVLGDGNFRFAIEAQRRGIAYYAARHENGAVAMADAWSRVSGRLGVATVTKGPGLTNALTALTEARKAHTPLLLLAGDTASTAVRGPQMIDQGRVVESLGVAAHRCRGAAFLGDDIVAAAHAAIHGRHPVVLSVPVDVQVEDIGDWRGLLRTGSVRSARPAPDPDAIARLADLVEKSSRPVIVGGWGAYLSEAEGEIAAIADLVGAALATSATAKGMFHGHPLAVGVSGGFSTELGAAVLSEADLVIAFGAALNPYTTRHGSLYAGAAVAQIDDRPDALGAHVDLDVGVLADCRLAARALLGELRRRGHSRPDERVDQLARRIEGSRAGAWPDPESGSRPDSHGHLHPAELMASLGEMLPDARVVVTDSGNFFGFPATYLASPRAGAFLFPQAYQAVGLGLAHAAGAAVAAPGRLVVAIVGDGGLMMSLGEVDTLVRCGQPCLVVVMNDSAYGAEVHILEHLGLPSDLVVFPDRDIATACRSLGAQAHTVREMADLEVVANWLHAPAGVLVADCKVDRRIRAPFMDELLNAPRV